MWTDARDVGMDPRALEVHTHHVVIWRCGRTARAFLLSIGLSRFQSGEAQARMGPAANLPLSESVPSDTTGTEGQVSFRLVESQALDLLG